MAEKDALSTFDFSKVTGGGLFVKFTPGESLTLRVLTTDPIVANESYEDKRTNETIVGTKFSFIVYNWTEGRAQIWKATPNTAKRLGELHIDPDFGANIRKVDIKVTAPEKGEIKAYEIQVLPTAKTLTNEMITEAQAIKLEEKVEGDRMSLYEPTASSGYEQAKAAREALQGPDEIDEETEAQIDDKVIDDIGDGPINLDDIPF